MEDGVYRGLRRGREIGGEFLALSGSRAGAWKDGQGSRPGVGHVGLKDEVARLRIVNDHAGFVGVA